MIKKLFSCAMLALSMSAVAQTAGSLDTGFGDAGKVLTNIGNASYHFDTQAVQADGKIIMAGNFSNGSYHGGLMLRLNTDGSIDGTFAQGGILDEAATIGFSQILVQPDGKILARESKVVFRYNADGSVDNTFGTGGSFTINFSTETQNYYIRDFAVSATGKIVLIAQYASNSAHAIAQYTSAGIPDTSFDADGIAYFSSATNTNPEKLLIQPDNKIVVLGHYFDDGGVNGTFAKRFTASGLIDTSFGVSGNRNIPTYFVNSAALQADGKIVYTTSTGSGNRTLRLTANGVLDTTFGNGGNVLTTNTYNGSNLSLVKVQSDGKILVITSTNVGGNTLQNINHDISLFRYNSNGTADTTFDTDGKLTFSFAALNDEFNGVDLYNNKIIVTANSYDLFYQRKIAVGVLTATGAFDTGFSGDGKVIYTATEPANDVPMMSAQQADGKIVTVGGSYIVNSYNNNEGTFPSIARYNTDGSLDTTFGGFGRFVLDMVGSLNAVAIQPDGKIVVTGDFELGNEILRFNANGTLDTTFGTGGAVKIDFAFGFIGFKSVKIQPDGKIVLAGVSQGFFNDGPSDDFLLARLNTNGTLDTTFGTQGLVTAGSTATDDVLRSMILQPDGKIIIAGDISNGADYDAAIVRYNNNGTLDVSFNGNGIFTTALTANMPDGAYGVDLQADGKIVAATYSQDSNGSHFSAIRLTAAGSLDTTFDNDGKLVLTGINNGISFDIKVTADQKILLCGKIQNNTVDFGLLRLNSNGSPDSSFGTNGLVSTDFGDNNEGGISLLLTNDNKAFVTGYAYRQDNTSDFALAKYDLSSPLGVNAPVTETNLRFAPNPATDQITFNKDITSASIFDISGKMVQSQSGNREINVAQLPAGAYFVKAIGTDGVQTVSKLIKK